MMTKRLKVVVFAALIGACGGVAAAAIETPPRADRRALEKVADREDRDTGEKVRAMAVCGSGFSTQEVAEVAVACHVAYAHVLQGGDYEQAMRYALLGCERYQNPGLCRRAGGLPMEMGNQGIAVPPAFKGYIRRAADAVCFSGKRFRAINGADVTGRECGYFARLFSLARDPEYVPAFAPAAFRFYESMYAPEHAAKLYAIACERLGSLTSCQLAKEMGATVASALAGRVR